MSFSSARDFFGFLHRSRSTGHLSADPERFGRSSDERIPWRMKSSQSLHFKTYLLILLMVIFGPVGNVLLGKGMRSIGAAKDLAPATLFHFFWRSITSGTIWSGIGSLLAFFVAYLLVLSWADYSYVQPASSISYGMVALLGVLVLHEVIRPKQWIGIGIICLGVFIVGHTSPRTTKRN
jgi:uncharacterized membrane protein